ncbi:MAG: chorismate--pyruvate lyase [Pseudohongiella sp.]|nr:chorismate--pyruvate lyase [Pseudohongiella sp.]
MQDVLKHRPFRADLNQAWRPIQQCLPGPDAFWRDWLLESGSLTRRLQAVSDDTFQVRVLAEGWIRGSSHQMQLLGSHRPGHWLWSRHVELCLYGKAWVAAHSLIPYNSMRGHLRQLSRLRDKPLGGFLFEQPGLSRQPPEITRSNDCWGRRSLFSLQQRPLLVAEFFLPEMRYHLVNMEIQ